ncbi:MULTISPECIES: YceI family protein [Sphingobacterium]|uniref:Lipid-binding protein n=1 Tax=Sphingobacterium cellulitidis TaxID=1768011 RepID=A0A8H9KZC5_9SPHI|nr:MULTISPECIES: YceI family protein [Sphingobacterium]MBA8988586.1 polyisoprenoid-binding protein YceI [Sphingobacterium soli]OYD43213.1 lipid-binding protein [Sphingobacterium cellulitidis]OYD47448.1 lipid-binding protein [Sphingobacterium cellulitidis]WFB62606.1 YceI family protein [Sphingobacterium sp. WM]GGE34008.1 lipid-binding protein [Sphingobacterium soli]
MKKITLLSAVAAFVLASCAGNPEGKKAETKDSVAITQTEVVGNTLNVDTAASKVVWTGTKVTGKHTGTVSIKSGTLNVDNGKLVGGNVVLDMNTISSTDLEGEFKGKLDGHLKSEDFFAVASHPEATFTITEVKPGATDQDLNISGNLVIKGVSKNITFDAKIVESTEATVKATANFNITRADWGVNYEGKSDDLISKEINFDINLVANK